MLRPFAGAALMGVLGLAVATTASAQPAGPPAPSKNPMAAPAGAYKLDPRHTSIVARVPHMNGLSYSTFRFGASSGTLAWDPAKVEAAKLDITVEPASIMTPVPKFGEELAGDKYLTAAKFPTAQFVSTGIRKTGPTTGQIIGNLTFMGVTKPMTINGDLVGVGKDMRGNAVMGFSGTARMKRSDWGFTALIPAIGDNIELLLDTEFDKLP
jgi:polyisoprenoid-binding protein YceI